MTQKEYIKALNKGLRFKLPKNEIREILADIVECFEEGAAEGLSEDEISIRLGAPDAAAEEFAAEHTGLLDKASGMKNRLISLLLCAAASIISVWGQYKGYNMSAAFFALPAFIWFMLHRERSIIAFRSYPTELFSLAAAVVLLIGSVVMPQLIQATVLVPMTDGGMFVSRAEEIILLAACGVMFAGTLKKGKRIFAAVFGLMLAAQIYLMIQGEIILSKQLDPVPYAAWSGTFAHNLLEVCLAAVAATALYTVLNPNAFTVPALWLCSGAVVYLLNILNTLHAFDPGDKYIHTYSFYELVSADFLTAGVIAAFVSLAAIIMLRRTRME